ncbi:MAG TPA: hypothetical protein VMW80_04005 [Candidatus Dormibacteraeota bacterium]|nr:hypothetical protein [Candidatus Dormibacteraeota bacterium]
MADSDVGLSFAELRRVNALRVERWRQRSPRTANWSGADWSNAMCGEAGEAANVVKKLRRYECGVQGTGDLTQSELMRMLGEEVADVAIYLDLLAAYYGISLGQAVTAKFNKVSERERFPERL